MIKERQPTLTRETEETSRVVGHSVRHETARTKVSTVIDGLLVASTVFLIGESASAALAQEGTSEPTNDAIATPDTTEQPPTETIETTLEGYPNRVEFHPAYFEKTSAELNPSHLEAIRGTDGHIIVPGYYSERPLNLGNLVDGSDQLIESSKVNINGVDIDVDYIVGFVTDINRPGGVGLGIYVSFPARFVDANGRIAQESSKKHYATVYFGPAGQGQQVYAISPENGLIVPPPADSHGGRFSMGTNPNSDMTVDAEGNFTFPTEEGPQAIHEGDPIAVAIVRNANATGNHSNNGENGDADTDEVIASLMDNDTSNDITWAPQYHTDAPPAVDDMIAYLMKH